MTSNINIDARWILHLFVIALCVHVVSKPLNRKKKITKFSVCKFMFESILKTVLWKSFMFLLMIDNKCSN